MRLNQNLNVCLKSLFSEHINTYPPYIIRAVLILKNRKKKPLKSKFRNSSVDNESLFEQRNKKAGIRLILKNEMVVIEKTMKK